MGSAAIETGRRRFILVTGAPRSGTTPVGTILSASRRVSYVYEPLNADTGLVGVDEFFAGPIAADGDVGLEEKIASVTELRMRLKRGAYETDTGIRAIAKNIVGGHTRISYLRTKYNPMVSTVVWKDPFAALLVPFLSQRGIHAVITVRSPFAVAASFKRLGWGFDLERIHDQIAADCPEVPLPDSVALHKDAKDPTANAAGLWALIYGYLARRTADSELVQWVDVAEVISDPLRMYQSIFNKAQLDFTDRVRSKIVHAYQDRGSEEPAVGRAHDKRRNVQQANDYWKRHLTEREIETIGSVAGDALSLVNDRIAQ